jgi:hypothetical protein
MRRRPIYRQIRREAEPEGRLPNGPGDGYASITGHRKLNQTANCTLHRSDSAAALAQGERSGVQRQST